MSSTEINVGLLDGGRSSSRVLKPPGGGHSDIFGIYEEEKPRTKVRQQNSEIKSCFSFEDNKKESQIVNVIKEKEVIEEKPDIEQKQDENSENAAPEKKPEDIQQPLASQRVRVPPGGFSSGLW